MSKPTSMTETKPGLPTTPGTYRLQYKGGHEIILKTDGRDWYFLSGVERETPRDIVCHAPIVPLVAPDEPKPVSLVERLRKPSPLSPWEAYLALALEAADAIDSLTKERDALRELLIKARDELLVRHKLAVDLSKSTWIIDQIDAALGK